MAARLQLGITYRRAGHVDDAIATYREIVRDMPRYARAWYNLGVAYNAAGRTDESRGAYQTALKYDPHHQRSLKNLGLLEASAGPSDQARVLLEDALAQDPTDDEVRVKLAELHFRQGGLADCLREAQRVLTHQPNDVMARGLALRCQSINSKD